MAALFGKWQKGLAKTRSGIIGQISSALRGRDVLRKEELDRLEEILLGGDIGPDLTARLIEEVKVRVAPGSGAWTGVRNVLREKLTEAIGSGPPPETGRMERPHVVLVVGVNGTGKTTSIGKLAHHYRGQGLKVLLGCADTFRAAAGEQLEIWAKRNGIDVVLQPHGADPASVAYDAVAAAAARKVDVLLLDTAGRLHTKVNLMEELKKIRRVIGKQMEGAPHEVLLVLDATTGQNGLRQAREFAQAAGVTGIVLTKLDGTARGGIVLAVQQELKVPVRWVGVGEGIEDLLPFDPAAFIEGLFRE